MSDMPPKDVLPQGKAAATKALEIDESLAEAHATLAFIHTLFDWDWAEAEKEAKRAIALYPNLALAHMAYAELLCKTGRHQEAITEGTRAQELDPLSLIINTLYRSYLYQARRNDEATARLQKTIELDPNFWLAYLLLGKIYFNNRITGLEQITPENVNTLAKAWSTEIADNGEQESSPIIWQGTMYLGTPHDNVLALDAATGKLKWQFPYDPSYVLLYSVTRGVGIAGFSALWIGFLAN